MNFSLSIEYAIHGLVYLASTAAAPAAAGRASEKPPRTGAARGSPTPLGSAAVLVGDIARATSVPESYLRKVLQLLSRAGLVSSHRGARGGFSLARPAAAITLKHVVEAIDGGLPGYTCAKAARGCSLDEACPVSSAFAAAREKMAEVLDATTIHDLARGIARRSGSWLKVHECA